MRFFRRHPTNIVQPENSFTAETPLDGSNERVISDLFPAYAVTATYPVVGTTTYGDLSQLNEPKPDGDTTTYNAFVLRRIREVPNTRFVRLYFTRVIPDAEKEVAYKTITYFDESIWLPPILYKVYFIQDRTAPIVTRGENGTEVLIPRYMARQVYTDDQRGALVIEEHFVSDTAHVIGMADPPRPISVQYDFYGVNDTFAPSLHKKLVFDAKQGAFAAYSTGGGAVGLTSSASGQEFPATNHETWQTYVSDDRQSDDTLLFHRVRKTVVPGEVPDPSKR